MDLRQRSRGLWLGLAVGDALGVPGEGLSRRRARKLFPPGRAGRPGLVSDDTELAVAAAQAWLEEPDDPRRFARALARRLRRWLLVCCGIGWATLRACVRLWFGVSPERSGVFSAGNGPLPRALVLGFAIEDHQRRRAFVEASTRITHTDPLALEAAHAIAGCAALARRGVDDRASILELLRTELRDPRWQEAIERLARGEPPENASGYVVDTLPAAVWAWLRGGDAIDDAIALGGDTDSVAALAGALAGACRGAPGEGPRDPFYSADFLGRLADRTLVGRGREPLRFRLLLPLRSVLFAAVAIAHGIRRMLPPY